MKLEHWQILFKAYRQVITLLDQWLPTESARGKERAMAHVGRVGLNQLQQQLLETVLSLQSGLGTVYDAEEIDEAVRPFIYLVDEMVLRRLSEDEQPDWPLLQYQCFGEDSGGDLFYDLADRKLHRPGPSTIVFEMLHFCLAAGFVGRYVGNVARLREYKEKLAACIPKPETLAAPPPPPSSEPPLLYEFPLRYYIGTAILVVAVPVGLWLLSRY
ncbi:DotU family type IV/VI secretion system protein [Archangium violaceum]|uniref:DotU family type IV/VI secretion system protein n=1 Tax=Archangium violaceum TaxID=83451 RepID=UPI00193B9FBC|nr:DotU family type IV/VI secretion system protein [Archangium violaceum]QRK06980.1 DotU family type IV/VI secretion system protein [Archangium violaceum]